MMNRMNARSLGLALGLSAAASTGCDKVNQPIQPVEITKEAPAPAQSAAPTTAPTAAPAPTPVAPSFKVVTKFDEISIEDADVRDKVCPQLKSFHQVPLAVKGESVFAVCVDSNTRIVKILDTCDSRYNNATSDIKDVKCYRDNKGFMHVVGVHGKIMSKTNESKPLVFHASDEGKVQGGADSDNFWAWKDAGELLGADPLNGYKMWLGAPTDKTPSLSSYVKPSTPMPSVVPVTPVVPTQENSDLNRRVGALERRVDGVEVEVARVKKRVDVVELMIPKDKNTKDAHSIAADAASK